VTEHEIAGFDLESFLTTRRRRAICSLEGEIVKEDTHHIRTRMSGLPYPCRRDMIRAAQGDIEATQKSFETRLWN